MDTILQQALATYHKTLAKASHQVLTIDPIKVGCTAKCEIFSQGKLKLYHYQPLVQKRHAIPMLIVYALVNRPYIVDLQPDRSLVYQLLQLGIEVYLIDWGYPDIHEYHKSLADYILDDIHCCVQNVLVHSNQAQLHLLGICQGGVLSLCYTALLGQAICSLTTMVTPIDFNSDINPLSHLVRHINIDKLIARCGNLSGHLLNQLLVSLRPGRMAQQYFNIGMQSHDDATFRNFLSMEQWLYDCPDQAGNAFKQFIKDFYQDNKLINGGVILRGQPVQLNAINQPVLNIYATEDHIVPPATTVGLKDYVRSRQYEHYAYPGGHVGIYASRQAQKTIPNKIAKWIKQCSLSFT